ncbi:VCBS repeat-containing protein [Streptomyces sp. T-3]|nr:VCBS repeat-containing protein [Streptomyces sp. T-3]
MPVRRRRHLTTALCCAALLAGCGSGGGGAAGKEVGSTLPPAGKPGDVQDHKDFNGDGFDDFTNVLHSSSKDGERRTDTLVVVYGSKTGLRPETTVRVPAGPGRSLGGPKRADLDDDGFTDLFATRSDGKVIAMYGGPRGLSGPRTLDLPKGFVPTTIGDFDGDGHIDLINDGSGGAGDPGATHASTDGTLLFGPIGRTGKAERQLSLDLGQSGYTSPDGALVGDFNADGRSDAVFLYYFDSEEDEEAPSGLTSIAYYTGDAKDGLRPGPVVNPTLDEAMGTFEGPRGGGIGDVNGDGIDDLVASGEGSVIETGKLTVIYGSKDGLGRGQEAVVLEGKGTHWGSGPMVGDVNGDKKPDVVHARDGFRLIDPDRLFLLPGGDGGRPGLAGQQEVNGEDAELKLPAAHEFAADKLLDVDGDGDQDLTTYSEEHESKGLFLVLPGTPDGLDTEHAWRFTPEDLGVQRRLS